VCAKKRTVRLLQGLSNEVLPIVQEPILRSWVTSPSKYPGAFWKQTYVFRFEKPSSLLQRWRCRCTFKKSYDRLQILHSRSCCRKKTHCLLRSFVY
jgi:hypothetical protein